MATKAHRSKLHKPHDLCPGNDATMLDGVVQVRKGPALENDVKMPLEGEKVRLSKSLLKSQIFLTYSVTFLKEVEDILTYV